MKINSIIKESIYFLLPNHCNACGKRLNINDTKLFCTECWNNIKFISGQTCKICSKPIIAKNRICEDCRKRKNYFTENKSIGLYEGILKDAIHLYKFKSRWSIYKDFIDLINLHIPKEYILKADLIAGIPITPDKEWNRGFNQTYLIAKTLSKQYNIKFLKNVLVKTKETQPQSTLHKSQRIKNLTNSFKFNKKFTDIITDKKILLIDDVFTTGTTINECAKILKHNNAAEIFSLTIARGV